MTDANVGRGRRPRSTTAQWITAAALVLLLAVVSFSVYVWWSWLGAVFDGLGDLGDQQPVQEAVCLPYANGVLELAAQGYTAEQIEAAYAVAAAPHGDTERHGQDEDAPPSYVAEYCGTPTQVIEAAPTADQ